jgi:hypothetical protein
LFSKRDILTVLNYRDTRAKRVGFQAVACILKNMRALRETKLDEPFNRDTSLELDALIERETAHR